MKLKIVQPEVDKKDEDVIELWLEYGKCVSGDVKLFSRKSGGPSCCELTISHDRHIEVIAFDTDEERKYRVCNPTNLNKLIIYP
jgi:hypothetical protein